MKSAPAHDTTVRVGLLLGTNQIGGSERQVSLLAKGLQDSGLFVIVLFMSRPRPLRRKNKLKFGSVPCVYLWDTRYSRSFSTRYLSYLLGSCRISVLHMMNLGVMEFGLGAARAAGLKHPVGSVRGILFSENAEGQERMTVACQQLEYVTCNSAAIQQLLIERCGCPPCKIRVIHNGVEQSNMWRSAQRHNNEFHVLFVGTLKDVKDPITFVKSGLSVLETHPHCRFVIAGDGPLKREIKREISSSAWGDHFELLGSVAQDAIPYESADLLVSTSLREGSSNAILEALAHGIPVVGTAVGGTPELLSTRAFGMLVPPGDVAAVANSIRSFCDKGSRELADISRDGRAFIRDRYSLEGMIERHVAFYQEIVRQS